MTFRNLIPAILVALLEVGCTPRNSFYDSSAERNVTVEVTPAKATYSIGHQSKAIGKDTNAFLVRFRVSSSNPYLIGVMTCSYFGQWRTDNETVSVDGWPCASNYPILRLLASTNPYTGELPLVVHSTAKGSEITFRMAFSPITNFAVPPPFEGPPPVVGAKVIGGTYWSEKITIKIAE